MGVFAVIADDLTGAGDTGAQFAKEGFRTRVFLRRESLDTVPECDIVVVNTDSRWMEPGNARSTLIDTARYLKRLGVVGIYKKIDSTFRGNVAEETEALLEEFGFDIALIAPAFPANARTVVGGYLLVNGEPVSRTAIGNDPVCPVTESFLPALLASKSKSRVAHLPLSMVTQGPEAVAAYLKAAVTRGERLILADAVSVHDLENLVLGARKTGGKILYVGSAGLASQMAKGMRAGKEAQTETPYLLVVCGSVNPRSREQVALLLNKGPGWESITVDPIAYMNDESSWEKELSSLTHSALSRSPNLRGLALLSPGQPSDIKRVKEAALAKGMDAAEVPGKVSEALAKAAVIAIRELRIGGFILTGGDTAAAVTSYLGSSSVDLVGEVSPGIPIGRLVDGPYRGFPVVTKAGGFGGNDALCEAAQALRNLK